MFTLLLQRFVISSTKRSPPTSRVHVPISVNRSQLVPSSIATHRSGPRTAVSFRISILLDAPNPARRDRGPFTAAADKTRRVPSIGQQAPGSSCKRRLEASARRTRAHGARRAPHRAEQTSSIQKTRRVLGDASTAEPLERRSGSFDTASSSARARAINGATYTPGKPRRPRRRLDQKSRVS